MTTWVVGGGGLLGSAVLRALARQGRSAHRSRVPWRDAEGAVAVLTEDADRLLTAGSDVDLLWCAGAGVVATSAEAFEAEVAVVRGAMAAITRARRRTGARVRIFLASSAGGVYAGSADPPFTEATEPTPLAPYGHAKLAIEEAVREVSADGISVLLGRIANLYGPGQDLAKAQGLVAQLCRAQISHRPLSMYVSLDTARDYLYVDDAAALALAGLHRLADEPDGTVVVKILASGHPTTLASIIGELSRITRRRPPLVLGASPSARFQVRDLRFTSTTWPELDLATRTPLPAGIAATLSDVATKLASPVS